MATTLAAAIPRAVSRLAPGESLGMAMGVVASLRFFGAFFGAPAGGYLDGKWATAGVVILNAVLIVIRIATAAGIRVPAPGFDGQSAL